MGSRTIPLIDQRQLGPAWDLPQPLVVPKGELRDLLARPLRDLRISVTDRCNFRCNYCMPKEVFDSSYTYLPQSSLLSFEEITRVARQFVAHGVQKIRLTGGEPLLRKHIEVLIAQLSELHDTERNYVKLLKMILDVFKRTLESNAKVVSQVCRCPPMLSPPM